MLELGEIYRGNASVLQDTSLLRSKELTLVELHVDEAPFAEFCGDVVTGNAAPSIWHTDPICS